MGFMDKVSNSWDLFKQSLSVMREHKTLMVFPAVTFASFVVITLFFMAPVAFQSTGYGYTQKAHWQAVQQSMFTMKATSVAHTRRESPDLTNKGAAMFALLYFVVMFIATFFSVAFYHEIFQAFEGQGVSLTRGILFAVGKLQAIVLWSLFAGAVGYLIRMLEERVGFFGKFIVGLIGVAWSVASVFAIPVMIKENTVNPLHLLRRSSQTLKKTWGESLVGYVGMQSCVLVFVLVSMVLFIAGVIFAAYLRSGLAVIAVMALWTVSVFAFIYLVNVANSIYRCALYTFASTGKIPVHFDEASMSAGWKMKVIKD